MAFCSNCGQKLGENANFCSNCGKAVDGEDSKTSRKTVYDGEVHKCPNCGERLDSFVTICPVCEYELRGMRGASCVKELAEKIEKASSTEKKIELIQNFYIPNTKEDIYEFFILATSNITAGGYGVDAWSAKLDQAYQKAKISFGNAPEFEGVEKTYKKTKRKSFVKSAYNAVEKSVLLKSAISVVLGVLLMVIGMLSGPDSSLYLLVFVGMVLFISVPIFLITTDDSKKKRK